MKVRTVLLSSAMLLVLSCLAPDITGRGIARAESSPHGQGAGPGGVLFPRSASEEAGFVSGGWGERRSSWPGWSMRAGGRRDCPRTRIQVADHGSPGARQGPRSGRAPTWAPTPAG